MSQLLRAWIRRSSAHGLPGISRVELHLTPDITTNPPGGSCDFLINPANERLEGAKFTPSEANARLAPNTGVIYPEQTVDGRVDELGGIALRRACRDLPEVAPGGIRCRVGEAVVTETTGMLLQSFRSIVHTVPPVFGSSALRERESGTGGVWQEQLLASCYSASLDAVWRCVARRGAGIDDCYVSSSAAHGSTTMAPHEADDATVSVAVPLLGAGARGVPVRKAADAAAAAVSSWAPSLTDAGQQRGGLLCIRNHHHDAGGSGIEHGSPLDGSHQTTSRVLSSSTIIAEGIVEGHHKQPIDRLPPPMMAVKFAVVDDILAEALEDSLNSHIDGDFWAEQTSSYMTNARYE